MRISHPHPGLFRTLAALALLLALTGWLGCAKAADAVGTFSIEQVYVNVPEMDIFVYALDGNEEPISPMAVQAAGVEVTLGDDQITPGNILMSNEPICYIFVLDNTVDAATLSQFRLGVRQMIAAKGERDQIALYTTAGGVECALSATSNRTAALSALADIQAKEDKSNFADAATRIYQDINENYQSIAPRKVIIACTDVVRMMTDMTLMGGMMTNAASQLNMAVYTFLWPARTRNDLLSWRSCRTLLFIPAMWRRSPTRCWPCSNIWPRRWSSRRWWGPTATANGWKPSRYRCPAWAAPSRAAPTSIWGID